MTELRSILELLYFLATIGLFMVAVKGLSQINIGLQQIQTTRDIAKEQARRDAFKIAHEQCRFFAAEVIEKKTIAAYDRVFFKPGQEYDITVKGDRFELDKRVITKELKTQLDTNLQITYAINAMEGFALFFASGIAEDEIGFRETGIAFTQLVRIFGPAFYVYQVNNLAKYKSCVELYESWNERVKKELLEKQKEEIEGRLETLRVKEIKSLEAR
jgi:hypothetical protein